MTILNLVLLHFNLPSVHFFFLLFWINYTCTLQSCQVVFELFSILIPKNQYFAEEISIFPRGNNMTKKNTFLPHMPAADLAFFQGGASSTSRVAASRFFLLFWTPVSDVFLASMHISHIHEPRSGEPIFFAILNPRKWCFPGIYAHITYPRAA